MVSMKVLAVLLAAVLVTAMVSAQDEEGDEPSGEHPHAGRHWHQRFGHGDQPKFHVHGRDEHPHWHQPGYEQDDHHGVHGSHYRDHHPAEGAEEGTKAKAAEHHEQPAARDCSSFHGEKDHALANGVYNVHPDHDSRTINVYCDMTSEGGPWTVLARRSDGKVNFTRTWAEYVLGFGSLKGEFWIGLEAMHQLTESGLYELRVEAVTTADEKKSFGYRLFHIGSRDQDYILDVEGFNLTTPNMLAQSNRHPFAAYDRVTASGMDKCAMALHGGWWYSSCKSNSHLGVYVAKHGDSHDYGNRVMRPDGTVVWIKSFEMKIRPAKPAF